MRTIKHISLLLLTVPLLALFSCQKQEDETYPVLTIRQELFQANGGSKRVEVASTSAWTLSVDYGNGPKDWIELEKSSGEPGVFQVKMTVLANDGDAARQATLVLKGITLQASGRIIQAGASGSANAPMWMELPALDRPELYFFTHDWEGGQYISKQVSPKRNYSFYWDKDNYVSIWVAYPLNTNLKSGSYGRWDEKHKGNEMIPDPILQSLGLKQPDLRSGSYGGGWTRGHQIPSYDRQASENTNKATYYVTNMTPQEYNFNTKIWAKLESKVRTYSEKCDTLYVVTGALIKSNSGWSGTNGGVSARVPSAYYKALLRRVGNDYSAAAYYMPHDKNIASGNIADYIISVSDLEQLVGVDFFVNLPTVVGAEQAAKIESANPATVVAKW